MLIPSLLPNVGGERRASQSALVSINSSITFPLVLGLGVEV